MSTDLREWQAGLWGVPVASLHQIGAEALRALGSGMSIRRMGDDGLLWGLPTAALRATDVGEYRNGSVRVVLTDGGYLVTFGGRERYAGSDREQMLSAVLICLHRRCTSCGQRGCPQDLVGRKTFLVDPLPEAAL